MVFIYNGNLGIIYNNYVSTSGEFQQFSHYRLVPDQIVHKGTMTCQPGAIHTRMSEESFSRRSTGKGATHRECVQWYIPCMECRVELTAGSMTAHRRRLYDMEPAIDWDLLPVSYTEYLTLVYEASLPTTMKSCQCPLPGCPGTSHSRSDPRNHFRRIHCGDSILIIEEYLAPFLHCGRCGWLVPPWLLKNLQYNSEEFWMGKERH